MEGGEDLDNYSEEIDDFYVVDSWSEKPSPDLNCDSSGGNNILSKEDKLSRRKPTEGEIDEFLENLKELNSKCGTSGLEGSTYSCFDTGKRSSNLIKIPEGSSKDTLCLVLNRAGKLSSEPVKRFNDGTVSYKPGETLTETFFSETSVKDNDLSRSISNNQEIGIPSSDTLFYVSFDRNEDSGGGFSDVKGTGSSSGPHESTTMEGSSHQPRRARSRSPYTSSTSRYLPARENVRFPPREGGRNHPHLENFRTVRNGIQDRRHDDTRRHRRSKSRSRERKHHRRRSSEYRPSLSLSPTPPKREIGKKGDMEPRQLQPYYPSSGAPMPPNPTYMNPNTDLGLSTPPVHGPVQYPINPVSSNTSYGQYPSYNIPANNLFNSSHTQPHSFQPQMPQNFPQNQYPDSQNYHVYNPGGHVTMQGNPPNPVPFPASWNQPQSTPGFNQNYTMPNVSTDAVMYPHLKIGQTRLDGYRNSHQESLDGSPRHKQSKSSLEKRKLSTSRSPDGKKHKRKSSKRHSKSPSLDRKYEASDKKFVRRNKSPVKSYRIDFKKPKVIIDPNRIPTPPPPPIVGSYEKDESRKSVEQKGKTLDLKSDVNPLSDFLNKEKVSLSCLLEAVMENSGQGKSQLSDPKVKKEIISNCESKIQHLYKRRMTGLGAFIPDPVQSSRVIAHISPLVTVYSHFTYNCEEESSEWHCPEIIVPDVKTKKDLKKVSIADFTTSQPLFQTTDSHSGIKIENPTIIPTLSKKQSLPELNWNADNPDHVSQHNIFPNAYENNQQIMFSSQQAPQTWMDSVHPPNPYSIQPLMPDSANEYSSLGPPPYMLPSYPFPHRPQGPQFLSQHGYPPQPEMLNYPARMDYPPMHHFPSQNLNQPRMFNTPQSDSNRSNYQYKGDENLKSKKNKNKVSDNLILLSNNSRSQTGASHKGEKGRNQNDLSEDIFCSDDRDKIPADNAKDKLLRKVWRLRKSSEYYHVNLDPQETKDNKDEFYNKLNYAEMQEDTQLDTIHDYQLTNLRERIETCLAEGKSSPGHTQHRNRDRKESDRERDRHKDRDRVRDKIREGERLRRGSMEGERKWHGRSPLGDERKKYRPGEGHLSHEHSRKSKEPSDKKDHCKKSNKDDVIEILSDEDQNKHKLSGSCPNEGLMDPDEHLKPSEKTLMSLIFDSLGVEIRKIQEKSDLYKSIIDSLDKGDKAYKRLYSFRNTVLMKSEKDNRMKMVIPRDNLKEVIITIHKSFHHVQNEELSRLLKNIVYPYMLYIPKCVSKVMSECPICTEEKKKQDQPLKEQKSDKTEKKPDKRNNRSLKDREKDRRHSVDRHKRVSKDRSSSALSKGRRDHLRSGREQDTNTSDGIPSGYEKAIKVRKPGASSSTKSELVVPDNQFPEEGSNVQSDVKSPEELHEFVQSDVKSTQELHGLSDKALEFKHSSGSVTDVFEDRSSNREILDQQLSAIDKKDFESTSVCCIELSTNDLEDEKHDSEMESSSLVMKTEMESSDKVTDTPNNKDLMVSISESSDSEIVNTEDKDKKPSDSEIENIEDKDKKSSDSEIRNIEDKNKKSSDSEMDKKTNNFGDEIKESNVKGEKASLDQISNGAVIENKAAPKLDFKGRVRQVQMVSNECKDIIMALELGNDATVADPSYLIKGGMLCRKDTTGNVIEVKIVTPSDELDKVVNIVHTMSAVHTPATKVVTFFSKHFTQVENLDLKVNEIVGSCSYCKLKSS